MIKAKNVHIIGIGGIGTSAVAKWWLHQGVVVSGSDMHPSDIVDDVNKRGVDARIGHFAENVPRDCDLVIYSRAVQKTNVERQIAAERGIAEMSYPEFLGELAKDHRTIAVSGTNGKSTTAAMIAKILIDAGYDPTVIIGTASPDLSDGNLNIGQGDWLVLEACEHMASMLQIKPETAVVTNIEEDHLDFYRDLDHIRETFQAWVDSAKKVVLNTRDIESQKLKVEKPAWFDVKDRQVGKGKQTFHIISKRNNEIDVEASLKIPGEYNAMNAAAAATAAFSVGIEPEQVVDSLADFAGTWRRFEKVGIWKGSEVYSDYAHHPTAIIGALKAFREFFSKKRLVLCFEPHQHSRTQELFDDFIESFDEADALVISEIYGVTGRTENESISSNDLVEKIKDRKTIDHVLYAKDYEQAESHLRDIVEEGDILIIMGAGTIDNLARKIAG